MRERKTVTVSADIVKDASLSDAEFRLFVKLSLNYGNESICFNKETIADLNVSKSALYRMLSELVKRQYLQRNAQNMSYRISVPIMGMSIPKNETDSPKIGNSPGFFLCSWL